MPNFTGEKSIYGHGSCLKKMGFFHWAKIYRSPFIRLGSWAKHHINGHSRILNWRYLPYIKPIFQAYVREYPPKIWPQKWYSSSILGSWNSHWSYLREKKTRKNTWLSTRFFQPWSGDRLHPHHPKTWGHITTNVGAMEHHHFKERWSIIIVWLVVYLPLWKTLVNISQLGLLIIPSIGENKKCSTQPTSRLCL